MMRRHFYKVECEFCHRMIGSNNFAFHQTRCKPALEAAEKERLEYIKTKPIERLTIAEAKESGRWDEFVASLKAGM